MGNSNIYDYLIIGQGLAGSILAWQLIQAGKKVLVLDDQHKTAASWVAAGLINPLAGMRFNCAPHTDAWLDSAHTLYQKLGQQFGQVYWHPIAMQRLFRSREQIQFYQRQRDKQLPYLGDPLTIQQLESEINANYGGFTQFYTGYINTQALLTDLANWLTGQQALQYHNINYQTFSLHEDYVRYAELQAKQVIFCEGYRMQDNPWFQALPLQPDKGEILDLQSTQTLTKHIINGSHWLIPQGKLRYRFGSTHEHKHIDTQTTTQARQELAQGLQTLLKQPKLVNIIGQQAGVRPATSDRQPFIGTHPQQTRLHIFNGFGARGALTIPWYAKRLRDYLLYQQPLPENADIQRYAKLL
jgi:glycine oxidase